jgi:hypothetical protein
MMLGYSTRHSTTIYAPTPTLNSVRCLDTVGDSVDGRAVLPHCTLNRCVLMMRSSIVFRVRTRKTCTVFFCPSRCARSIA